MRPRDAGIHQRHKEAGFDEIGNVVQRQSNRMSKVIKDSALASFNNTSIEDALAAKRPGLVGESEPLKRFNILLNETKAGIQGLVGTGKSSAKDLTSLEKVQDAKTL